MPGKPQIVIINDSSNETRYTAKVLIKNGYKVHMANTGTNGLQSIANNTIALVLVDFILPDMSGLEVISKIKTTPEHKHIPVVLFTAMNNTETVRKAFQAGATDFLSKSATLDELLIRIKVRIEAEREKFELQKRVWHSEQRFQLMLDNTHDIEFFRNADGEIEYVSPSIERILGYTREEYLAGHVSFAALIHSDDLEDVTRLFEKAKKGHHLQNIVSRYIHKNGSIVHGAVNVFPVFAKDNTFLGFRTSLRDVSEHVRLTNELENNHKRYQTLFDKNPSAILIINPENGDIYDANPAACNFYGYSHAEIKQKNISEFNISAPEHIQAQIKQAVSGTANQFTFQHKTRSGQIRDVDVYSAPFKIDANTFLYSIILDTTEKKKAQRQLVKQLKKLEEAKNAISKEKKRIQLIFDNVMDAIITINSRGIISMFNPSAEKQFGYTQDEVIGKNIKMLMPDPYQKNHDNYIKNYLNTNQKQIIGTPREVEALRKDGTTFPVEIRIEETQIGENKIFIGVIRDITKLKKQHNELLEREEKYRAIFDNSNDAIYLFGFDRKNGTSQFLEVNNVATEMLGYTKGEFLQMKPEDINAPSTPAMSKRNLRELVTKGSTLFQLNHQTKDNREIPVEIHAHYFKLKNQHVILSVARNITERVKAQQKLQSSEKRFRKLSEMSTQGILIHYNDNIVVDCNQRLCEIFDAKQSKIIGKNFLSFVSQNSIEKINRFAAKNITAPYEIEILTLEGTHKNIEVIAKTIEWHEKEAQVLTFKDITDRKKFENELIKAKKEAEEANRTRENFLSNITHEIRTPLNSIIGFSEMLSKKPDYDTLKRPLEIIKQNGVKLKELISFIIDTTNAQAGNADLNYQLTNIKELVNHLVNHHYIPIDKELEKIVTIGNNIPENIFIDQQKLRQIIRNILDNAIKFSKKGFVHTTVTAQNHSDAYCDIIFQIKDTGIGIKKTFLPKAFEYFSQQEQNSNRSYEGSGMGLAISKILVEMMNGKIFIASEEQKGTTVTVFFKQVKKQQASTLPNNYTPITGLKNSRVLLYSQKKEIVNTLNKLFENTGAKVFIAASSEELEHVFTVVVPIMMSFTSRSGMNLCRVISA
ncbi:MAG: PAS domain S-box protein, partial [Salinivirgaceae bacterium]